MEQKSEIRMMLLTTVRTYRASAFLAAAEKLGIEIVQAIDMPRELAQDRSDVLSLNFNDLDEAVAEIVTYADQRPLQAILSVDDSGSILAAHASAALNLPHNNIMAVEAARDKYIMRTYLNQVGILCPQFRRFSTHDDPQKIAGMVDYPCVVKPLNLSGSRGVIRANNSAELETAVKRTTRLIHKIRGEGEQSFLIEDYIPGVEVALEGLLENGSMTVLALFDKPDPLVGPFFEETIYVTPSRLPADVQVDIATCTSQAAAALGLHSGPIHAELRVNDDGPWIVELAGRSIGGLCGQTLQFGVDGSLEEIILRQACGLPITTKQTTDARGVMMIPIPEAGLLRGVAGLEKAQETPLIEEITITAPLNNPLVPLPEGDSYLGFIFARGTTPQAVESALRNAHAQLHFQIDTLIPITSA